MKILSKDEAKRTTRENIDCRDYLEESKGGLYCCPLCGSGTGSNGTGAVKYYEDTNTWFCHACKNENMQGRRGDVIDLYMIQYGTDYNTALSLLAKDLDITIDSAKPPKSGPNTAFMPEVDKYPTEGANAPKTAQETPTGADYRAYYEKCRQRLSDPPAASYLAGRGISLEIAAAYFLGYDPEADPASAPGALGGPKAHPVPRIIMPTSASHYVARRIDGIESYQKMNAKGATPDIFNGKTLSSGNPVVYVVEGIFDALSLISAGKSAVALCSSSNGKLLVSRVKDLPKTTFFILCPDNDSDTDTAARVRKQFQALKSDLESAKVPCMIADITAGYKDANEAWVNGREGFLKALEAAEKAAWKDPFFIGIDALVPEGASADQREEELHGLFTAEGALEILQEADDRILEIPSFPVFSATAKIRKHDTVALSGQTGLGKSALAINMMHELLSTYPCMYFNLEMDMLDILRRIAALEGNLSLEGIEQFKKDPVIASKVKEAFERIAKKKPLQVVHDQYKLDMIEDLIAKATAGRDETTIVFIDHALLIQEDGQKGNYERFTEISEKLRKISLKHEIIMFVILQQNRDGKKDENERPKLSSLKESGSWENDSTHVTFLWYDPADRQLKILMEKNRHGSTGDFVVFKRGETLKFAETKDQGAKNSAVPGRDKNVMAVLTSIQKLTFGRNDIDVTKGEISEDTGLDIDAIDKALKKVHHFENGILKEPKGFNDKVRLAPFKAVSPGENPFNNTDKEQDPDQEQEGDQKPKKKRARKRDLD